MGDLPRLTVAVVFGGRSVEHDVSIITGIQACEVLKERHNPIPVYIARNGKWYAGGGLMDIKVYQDETYQRYAATFEPSHGLIIPSAAAAKPKSGLFARATASAPEPWRPDIVLPACHGTQGEDGCLQGLLELADLPYAGPPIEAAVLAMNKAITKQLLRAEGIPVLEDLIIRRERYKADGPQALTAEIRRRFPSGPVYIKPVSLGSSVGVTRATGEQEIADALELAFELDRVVLVEPSIEGGIEVNCAVVGRPGVTPQSSACEQPLSTDGFLSFEDKYLRGGEGAKGAKTLAAGGAPAGAPPAPALTKAGPVGAPAGAPTGAKSAGMASTQRIIPAPIGDEQTAKVKAMAEAAFSVLGCGGVCRVDMLIDAGGNIYVNECNTIPGSFSFYLWEPVGVPFADLMDRILELARADYAERAATTRSFDSNLLAARVGGAQGAKS